MKPTTNMPKLSSSGEKKRKHRKEKEEEEQVKERKKQKIHKEDKKKEKKEKKKKKEKLRSKDRKEEKKKAKKKHKKAQKDASNSSTSSSSSDGERQVMQQVKSDKETTRSSGEEDVKTSESLHMEAELAAEKELGRAIATSALDFKEKEETEIRNEGVTLVLFYQYVEPPWTPVEHKAAIDFANKSGKKFELTGRMRIAREGFNCTLTGSFDGVRGWCKGLREWCPDHFSRTEFKFTDNLPEGQRFPKLHAFPVDEIVKYGLAGERAPSIAEYGGCHLEPEDYHIKMAEEDTVIIDVRNHYEAKIGQFQPPKEGARWIDPLMRKSTEFPVWLDKPETKEMLKGKQVLMYCTGGIRCERASALLRQKIATEEDTKNLGIKGVYQLQGGIDKYFKKFPDGGYWNGKNYVFDKRFAHAPQKVEAEHRHEPLSKCEACDQPWDKFRGKRRCPSCGVPSLICKECYLGDQNGTKKLDKSIRCDLCVEQGILSKAQLRSLEQKELEEYQAKMKSKLASGERKDFIDSSIRERKGKRSRQEDDDPTNFPPAPNPDKVTRLYIGNLCRKRMTDEILVETLPNVKYVQWLTDRNTGDFKGFGFVEMKTPEDASVAVGRNGMNILGRPIKVKYQPADGKDVWPPPNAVQLG